MTGLAVNFPKLILDTEKVHRDLYRLALADDLAVDAERTRRSVGMDEETLSRQAVRDAARGGRGDG